MHRSTLVADFVNSILTINHSSYSSIWLPVAYICSSNCICLWKESVMTTLKPFKGRWSRFYMMPLSSTFIWGAYWPWKPLDRNGIWNGIWNKYLNFVKTNYNKDGSYILLKRAITFKSTLPYSKFNRNFTNW